MRVKIAIALVDYHDIQQESRRHHDRQSTAVRIFPWPQAPRVSEGIHDPDAVDGSPVLEIFERDIRAAGGEVEGENAGAPAEGMEELEELGACPGPTETVPIGFASPPVGHL
jgi:hypothetical protein